MEERCGAREEEKILFFQLDTVETFNPLRRTAISLLWIHIRKNKLSCEGKG